MQQPMDEDEVPKIQRGSTPVKKKHDLDFKCQCKRCVRLYTISMQDAALLRKAKIKW